MPIPLRLLLPMLGLAGAASAQPQAMPMPVPPPDLPDAAAPVIAAPPHPGTMAASPEAAADPQAARQAQLDAQPGDRFGFRDVDDVSAFQPLLAPHGRWVESRWGTAFRPDVASDWRPYQNGEWAPGRFWRSADPWGWATDHYGRWGHDDRLGWVWVPGSQWAPSWTAWRDDDEVVGWAPVPPQVSYRWDAGFGNDWRWNDWNSWYAPGWVWVPRSQVHAGFYGARALPWHDGRRYWRGSRWTGWNGWGGGLGWNDWNRRGGTSISIGIGIGTGWNNWGWNSWYRPWAWNSGWNNWGWNNWGWNNGWNNWGWNRPGWNGRRWNDRGWNDRGREDRRWDRDPRRGAPGSVGDYIGRGLNGASPPAREDRRGEGRSNDWRGNDWRRNDGARNDWGGPRGDRGDGFRREVAPARPPSPGGDWQGGVSGRIGQAMAPPDGGRRNPDGERRDRRP